MTTKQHRAPIEDSIEGPIEARGSSGRRATEDNAPSMGSVDQRTTVDVLIGPDDLDRALCIDVKDGLASVPKALPPKWFYDDRGCELFDQITRLREYYPTRTERAILHDIAPDLARVSGADSIVELGSGTSDKTRILLDAFAATSQLRRFVPFEVNEATVRSASSAVASAYPGLSVHAVCGDFEHHLHLIPTEGRRMVAFLGSTIGNFGPAERQRFFAELARSMHPGDSLLLGTDLVKDTSRLEAAYNDSEGVTAEFNRNVLRVVNRRLDADFDVDSFEHRAFFDPVNEWIEMRLVSTRSQRVSIARIGLDISFTEGEEMRTEISAKFRRAALATELESAGLHLTNWFTDAGSDFALSLSFAG